LRLRSLLEEKLDLKRRDEQAMSVLAKAAATTAELADRSESRHFEAEFVVEGAQLGEKLRSAAKLVGDARLIFSGHFLTMAKEDRISVKE
jgi:hypothetical protein